VKHGRRMATLYWGVGIRPQACSSLLGSSGALTEINIIYFSRGQSVPLGGKLIPLTKLKGRISIFLKRKKQREKKRKLASFLI